MRLTDILPASFRTCCACVLRLFFWFAGTLMPMFLPAQNRYDILITECLPDPSPAVGLPESEFVELKNHSRFDYNLRGWKLSNGNSSATIKTDYYLKADSLLILCPAAAAADFLSFGPTLGLTGFLSLGNDAGTIMLLTDEGRLIHAIQYDKSWFGNELKASGGWSLEMIDENNPCTGKLNWTASGSPNGGTPGSLNSVVAPNPDEQAPRLLQAIALDSLDLDLLFDETLDSAAASNPTDYSVSAGTTSPETAIALPPLFNRVRIHLQVPMETGRIYTISVQHIRDCSGNEIFPGSSCNAGLPQKATNGDIIFNEILFNPPPYGFDYLEIYNRSNKIISISDLYLAGKDMGGHLKDPVSLAKDDRDFFPGEYLLLTENTDWVLNTYPAAPASQMISLPGIPPMPDDMGKLVLLNGAGDILDELDYDHHWHNPLLANESGVALERIRADLPTEEASNWTSAAAPAGYGTPGYKNSESAAESGVPQFISVEPKIFSPDMDGYQDFCFINYKLPSSGYIGSISIYDIYGRMLRKLVDNILWGTSGSFRWDGLDDRQNLLPMGHYIIYAELFLTDGTVKKQKLVCILARKP